MHRFKMLQVKVPIIFFGTPVFSAHRDRRLLSSLRELNISDADVGGSRLDRPFLDFFPFFDKTPINHLTICHGLVLNSTSI